MFFKLQTIKIGQIAHIYHLLLNFYNSDDTDFIIQLILITVICNYLSLHILQKFFFLFFLCILKQIQFINMYNI